MNCNRMLDACFETIDNAGNEDTTNEDDDDHHDRDNKNNDHDDGDFSVAISSELSSFTDS